ncbi:hypothetical protein BH10BAC3_BH10BAC3_08660 [soil metagenome]
MSTTTLSVRIWFLTSLAFGAGVAVASFYNNSYNEILWALPATVVAAVASLPALVVLIILLPFIKRMRAYSSTKWQLLFLLLLLTCLPYGVIASAIDVFDYENFRFQKAIESCLAVTGILFVCNAVAVLCSINQATKWVYGGALISPQLHNQTNLFSLQQKTAGRSLAHTQQSFHQTKTGTLMDNQPSFKNESAEAFTTANPGNSYNKILIKAAITAGLVLGMLIPTAYISNLVQEREQRHKEVVQEVSAKWASAQTLTTPYLCIPYFQTVLNDTGKQVTVRKELFIPASTLNVKADMQPEVRKRSIYNVLLYKSNISLSGNMVVKPAKDKKPESMLLNEASLCLGISDFKGIEEKISATFNGQAYDLEPGLPDYAIDKQGLSVPVIITPEIFSQPIAFAMNIKIKGSEQLHFLPLSDDSQFEIVSPWPNPSFDGSSLPKERTVTKDGFVAKWSFNKANMPILNQLFNTEARKESMAFGVSMVQPADQYSKTNRSVKYAVLFIGLTFAMFFIIELMQKKQVHPVQYILVGLALIIFYTLLLSIGEFIGFNLAYAIAASATILLIGIYATSMFSSYKTSAVLSAFLGMLYGFIYVLIQLEDTALLAGSIGLFVLLAIAMHFSKKINWYVNTAHRNPAIT